MGSGNVIQSAEHLPNAYGALELIPAPHKPGVVVHTCNPRTQEAKAKESQVQSHCRLLSKFEANLGYMRFYIIISSSSSNNNNH